MSEATDAAVSVIVRTKNSAATLRETLESIRSQTLSSQIVLVDSGSTDSTLDIAGAEADVVVHIEPARFSYGGALNAGASAAGAQVHVALSSHSRLPRPDWLATAVGHIRDGSVATCGQTVDGNGDDLTGPLTVNNAYLVAHPFWGLSNHASAWSAAAWDREHFDEQLTASEDREWSWRVTGTDGTVVIDPALVVPGVHRRSAGVVAYYRRLVNEGTSLGPLRPLPRYTAAAAARDWVTAAPRTPFVSAASRAYGRTRAIEVAARWRAGRLNSGRACRRPE